MLDGVRHPSRSLGGRLGHLSLTPPINRETNETADDQLAAKRAAGNAAVQDQRPLVHDGVPGVIVECAGGEFWYEPIDGKYAYRMIASNGLLRQRLSKGGFKNL